MARAYPLLVAATILCLIWCVWLWAMLPVGFVARLHGSTRLELTEMVGDQKARRLTSKYSSEVTAAARNAVIVTAVPLFVTMIGWGVLAYSQITRADRLRSSQDEDGGDRS